MEIGKGRDASGSFIPQATIDAIRARRKKLRQSRAAAPNFISLDGGSNHAAAERLNDEEPGFRGKIAMFGDKMEGGKKSVFEDIDDFIVESYSGGVGGKSHTLNKKNKNKKNNKEEYCYSFSDKSIYSKSSESFLSFCYTCKKKLGQEKDIYIYKGEKAFCSQACRCQEMMLDEKENSEF